MKTSIRLAAAAGALALAATGCTTSGDATPDSSEKGSQKLQGTIAYLSPNQTVTRWTKLDQPAMEKRLKKVAPDMKIRTFNAQDDATKQVQQVEAAITADAKAIILTAVDPEQTAAITARAKDAGIPVIAYAHEANNSDPDYYVTVPFVQIGEESATEMVKGMDLENEKIKLAKIYGDPKFFFYSEQAKGHDKVLNPLVKKGNIDVVCQGDSAEYDSGNAREAMDQCLTKTGDDLDAVLVTNDSTGSGVLASLQAAGLAGKVKVYGGYDAEVGSIQQLLAGNLSSDMRPDYSAMGSAAVEIVVDELKGEKPSEDLVNGVYDNKKSDIPTAYISNILIRPDNIDKTLVEPGIMTKDELCKRGPAVRSTYCAG